MVLKRYTPPTCTLEITAKSSPLSRWAGQPVFKSLNFELRLDDPRLPETKHVTLRGDRIQLEALHEAVSTYVQNFLCESRAWENSFNSEASPTVAETDSPPARNAVMLHEAVNPHELETADRTSPSAAPSKTLHLPVHPRLEPRGLLAHNLFLGSLSVVESGPVVHLSTIQLFDLATALDEYATEVMALPNLDRSTRNPLSAPWLRAAAMILASVGLTTGVIKLLDRPAATPQTASAPINPAFTPTPGQQQLAVGVSPSPVPAVPTPPATPTLAPLPPPPINVTASPSPSLPPIAPSPTPPTNKPSPIQPPALLFPDTGAAPNVASNAAPPSQAQTIVIPAPAEPPISETQAPPAPNVLPPVPPRLAPAAPPPLPPSLFASPFPIPPQQSLPRRIGAIVPPASTELPTLEDVQPKAESEDNQQATASKNNRTLFDTIPQVSEARTYFEERWKPPEGMQDTLEYSVQIDEKGSIQSIMPMGKAAGDYIDRTNMPLVGEPFVSAVSNGKNPRIRIVLRPNGRVQTFLEESN
jgi:Domain of unknown function (DUF4335)